MLLVGILGKHPLRKIYFRIEISFSRLLVLGSNALILKVIKSTN